MKSKYFLLIIIAISFTACEKAFISAPTNAPKIVFDALWKHIDENYIYFEVKNVDWTAIYDQYEPQIQDNMTDEALYTVCLNMLNELRDGHNKLESQTTERGADYKAGYDILFDLETVRSTYLKNDFSETGFYTYGMLDNNIAYIHYADFERVRNISTAMEFVANQNPVGLILDLRSNGGGKAQDAEDIVSYFINEPTIIGYMQQKIGKAQQAISEPLSITAEPTNFYFDKPVKLLINRSSFSATSYLAAMLKDLPNVTLVGQITGGGGGGNATFQLPNDWVVSVSVSKYVDINFQEIEEGVEPTIPVNNDAARLANGIDDMLDKALADF